MHPPTKSSRFHTHHRSDTIDLTSPQPLSPMLRHPPKQSGFGRHPHKGLFTSHNTDKTHDTVTRRFTGSCSIEGVLLRIDVAWSKEEGGGGWRGME
ncbi:hypothetical protein JTE90_025197 [Oedothorax gibbosus]|uniref:Uncharacterized protein n=1 Tax=Oedothorax gibbosus TaxID=931172 RepID=A0AAV6UT39_9ARAC|nr:hypothetical protein JTE90_025197 [Oedothorax gibbosus]